MRQKLLNQRSHIFWFTGLSGAGKSTLAHALEAHLFAEGYLTYVFDGDNVRHGLCGDLGFSLEDRSENIRRIGEMCKLFMESGVICLAAFISPSRIDRAKVRDLVGNENFSEIFVRCPLELCEERDVKGFYRKAKAGDIAEYTGISSPYEPPITPDLVLDTKAQNIKTCTDVLLHFSLTRIGFSGVT